MMRNIYLNGMMNDVSSLGLVNTNTNKLNNTNKHGRNYQI